ncbi:MAG: hypothetical protein B6I38_09135 [Anaerolineaceae bacterium 4572_5.1]|nr:MAG: hypothetical protein B6I38_09135 [Anaerolineaceae bacterium 4572_5.1]
MKTAIVTDSTSDIPQHLLEKYNIFQIPAVLIVEGKAMLDGEGITRSEFYNRLPTMKTNPTTAAPSTGSFQQLYRSIFQQGFTEIISIHVSSKLSGIYNIARITAQEFKDKIKVIDSQQLSLGIGFQVIAAAKASEQASSEQIIERIKNVRKRLKIIACLDTLEFIHRSGRVSWAKARLGGLLNLKPFLEIKNGEVLALGSSRSRQKGIQRMSDMLHNLGHLEYLAILHTNAKEDAKQFLANYALPAPENTLLINVTTIIGTHVGPNGLGFAAVVK